MEHYGDITAIHGYNVPIVDIITGGSPCQDLSVAGKRAGLAGERSGLFMEQIRIIKEMREQSARLSADNIRPRYMVWENVPGAFSSNNGEDFRAVLEETAKIADESAVIPRPEGGRWHNSGCILADGWSIAWRVHDAQFWGVAQRRRRIALVADFGGQTAPEILFERKSVCGYSAQSGEQGQRIAADAESGIDSAISFQERAGCEGGVKASLSSADTSELCQQSTDNPCYPATARALTARADSSPCDDRGQNIVCYGIGSYDSNAMKSNNPQSGIYEAETARTLDNNGGSPACNQGGMIVLEGNGSRESHKGNGYRESETMYTLNTIEQHAVCAPEPILLESNQNHATIQTDGISTTLPASAGAGGGYIPMVCDARRNGDGNIAPTMTGDHQNRITDYTAITYGLDRAAYNQGTNAKYNFSVDEEQIATQTAKGPGAVCTYSGESAGTLDSSYSVGQGARSGKEREFLSQGGTVRRLTPLECERLQGYPDGWTDIDSYIDSKGKTKQASDSARYKALGNSIALPFWAWLARRICAQYVQAPTMASLFDGIGGFPLVFSRAGCTPIWASEIEEFPIAVTKRHFSERSENNV